MNEIIKINHDNEQSSCSSKDNTNKQRSVSAESSADHSPIEGFFSKFEYPQYNFYNSPTIDSHKSTDNKVRSVTTKLYYKVLLYFCLITLLLVYCLPTYALDLILLKNIVSAIALINPCLTNYDKYSNFPSVAKFVYSLYIFTIPLQVLVIHKVIGSDLANFLNKKTTDELNVTYGVFIVLSVIPILFIYTLPLTGSTTSIIVRSYQTAKVSFAIITTLAFFLNAIWISMLISCRARINKLKINSNLREEK